MSEASVLAGITRFGPVLLPLGFFLLALCEALRPARVATTPLTLRWFGNIGAYVLGWPILALLPLLSAGGASVIARDHGWGLLNVFPVSSVVAVPMSIAALDLIAYWEHRLLHVFRPFWRLHALHHSDTDLDVATYIRHHPLEVLVQSLLDVLVVIAFGFSPLSVALFVTVSTVVQMIAHGNIELPQSLRWVAAVAVTPDFHRLHHSRAFDENNANFSNVFPIWDRWFGTLCLQPRGKLEFGLPEFVEAKFQRLDQMLILPLLIPDARLGSQQPGS